MRSLDYDVRPDIDIVSAESIRDVSDDNYEVCVQTGDKIVICGTPKHLHDVAHNQIMYVEQIEKLPDVIYS